IRQDGQLALDRFPAARSRDCTLRCGHLPRFSRIILKPKTFFASPTGDRLVVTGENGPDEATEVTVDIEGDKLVVGAGEPRPRLRLRPRPSQDVDDRNDGGGQLDVTQLAATGALRRSASAAGRGAESRGGSSRRRRRRRGRGSSGCRGGPAAASGREPGRPASSGRRGRRRVPPPRPAASR